MNLSLLRPGEQADMSIIDLNGVVMTAEEREEIVRSSHALPVFQKKDEIIEHLRAGNNLILDASTGSGKSTWGPIFAREATGKRVIQTVPRVLAAMTCAERISQILLAKTGKPEFTMGFREVGYRTGGGVSSNGTANLSVHTDGLEMMRQLYSGMVPEVLIVDEVQNKSIATELILFLTKYSIETQVIIMSATLDPELYRNYMKSRGDNMPIIQIPGKVFPIHEEYHTAFGCLDKTIELVRAGKHTLHMVSGKSRIEAVIGELKKDLNHGFEVVPLHAELTKEEQHACMIPPKEGITRIIVSTNVAEDSITIPYLDAVVDEGMNKVGRINNDGIGELRTEPATQASVKQRRGRIGRVKKEDSIDEYHRFNDTLISDLWEYPEAEIENSTLEREILLFAKAGKDISGIVNRAKQNKTEAFIHPVDSNLLNVGYARLEQIGALDSFGNITDLGEDLLSISLDPSHARMILEAIKKGVVEEVIVIAAILSVNGFLSKEDVWKKIKNGENKKSDVFMYLDLYDLATKKQINRDILVNLVYLGLDREQVQKFESEENTKAFYEVVDLSPLGIKNHRIAQIANKVNQIQNSLIERGIRVTKSKKISGKQINQRAKEGAHNSIQDIVTCIASGYPYYIFEYLPGDKLLKHRNKTGKESKMLFKQASTSSIALTAGKTYIGVPFIIGPDESMQKELESDESIFEGHAPTEKDLCILSHMTELGEANIKEAFTSHRKYISPFPKRKTQAKKGIANYEDLREKYDSLVEEFSQASFSHEDFLKYALPALIMIKNKQFIKFLDGKGPDVLIGLEQRLQKFLLSERANYIHRITKNIGDIESSFGGDSYIYEEFREWEQKASNVRKKERKGKRIDSTTADEIAAGQELFHAKNKLNMNIGRLEGGLSELGEVELLALESRMLGTFVTDMVASGGTYNTLYSVYNEEFGSMTEEGKKRSIGVVHEVEDDGNYKRNLKTRLRNIHNIKGNIQKLLCFCKQTTKENFEKIDFDYCIGIFGQESIKGLTTKSQKEKFHKGIQAIHSVMNNKGNSVKNLQALERGKRSFESVMVIFNAEENRLEDARIQKENEITEKKTSSFKTRKELHFFFTRYYDEEYFNTVISKKIPKILIEILSTGEFESTIERWISQEFEISRLKKFSRTNIIHTYLQKKAQYEKILNQLQIEVSRYNKGDIKTVEDINVLTEVIDKKLKTLSDLKSQILSIA